MRTVETNDVLDRISLNKLGYVNREFSIEFLAKEWLDKRTSLDNKHLEKAKVFDTTFQKELKNTSHLYINNLQDDIDIIIEEANKHFGHSTQREETYFVFKDCKSVVVVGDLDIPMVKSELYDDFIELLQPFLTIVNEHYKFNNMSVYNIIISKLMPGDEIPIHKDEAFLFKHTHRVHWCLQAEPGVEFVSVCKRNVDGKNVFGPKLISAVKGDIFELNNDKLLHAVFNKSEEPRYHVIIDCFDSDVDEGVISVR